MSERTSHGSQLCCLYVISSAHPVVGFVLLCVSAVHLAAMSFAPVSHVQGAASGVLEYLTFTNPSTRDFFYEWKAVCDALGMHCSHDLAQRLDRSDIKLSSDGKVLVKVPPQYLGRVYVFVTARPQHAVVQPLWLQPSL